jgi:excisionase family DNA binding protein
MVEFIKNRASYPDDLEVWQVAKILGCTQRYVYQLLREKQLAYYRIGKKYAIDTDDLVHFLESRKVSAKD